jgi:acyl dehydratase
MSRYDDLAPDREYESRLRTISAEDVAAFAALTGDHSALHLDAAAAAAGPYGRPIAHGMLVVSCSIGLAVELGLLGDDLLAFAGIERLRFVAPVFVGDAVAVRKRVVDRKAVDDGRGLVSFDTRIVSRGIVVAAYLDKYLLRR